MNLVLSVIGSAQGPGGPPGGGGGLPPGYQALNSDWAVKTTYAGTFQTLSWMYDGLEVVSVPYSEPWPPMAMAGGSNSTHQYKRTIAKSTGTIKLEFLWRHLPQTPPETLRLKMSSSVGVLANWQSGWAGVDGYALDSGIGLPVEDGIGTFSKVTPGQVLRKVKISASGEGEMTITQKAEIEVVGGYSTCEAFAPSLSFSVDERDVSINSIFGTWPKIPVPDGTTAASFIHSQDYWPYYPEALRQTRTFTWNKARAEPAPIAFPSDATDFSEWHVGLFTGYQEVWDGPEVDAPSNRVFVGATFVGGVTLPAVGDVFEWRVSSNNWRASDPVGPFQSPRTGIYDGVPINAWSQDTAYIAAKQFKVMSGPQMISRSHEAGATDTASFSWTWEDGLRALSQRSIKLHQNKEPEGQKSQSWLDLRVGADWVGGPVSFLDNPEVDDIEGFVDPGVPSCILGQIPNLQEVLGSLLSATGPAGAVLAGVGLMSAAEFAVAFAAAEMVGALIGIAPANDGSAEFGLSLINSDQVDSIFIEGASFNIDTNDDGNIDAFNVSEANYSNPALLRKLRAAIANSGLLQFCYWKPKVRKIQGVEYELWNLWGSGGFRGQEVRPHLKEKGLSTGYVRLELKVMT